MLIQVNGVSVTSESGSWVPRQDGQEESASVSQPIPLNHLVALKKEQGHRAKSVAHGLSDPGPSRALVSSAVNE